MPTDPSDDEPFVFDEKWAAAGMKESTLRDHDRARQAEEARQRAARARAGARPERNPANVHGNPYGPRDWRPAEQLPPRQALRRRLPVVAFFAVALAGLITWVSLSPNGSSGPPISAPTGAPITGDSSGSTPGGSASDGPEVDGISPGTPIGTCLQESLPQSAVTAGRTSGSDRVTAVDCASPHTVQLVKIEPAAGTNGSYPGDAYWNGPVARRCEQDVLAYTHLARARWPIGFSSSEFYPRRSGWASGDRTVYCLAAWAAPSRIPATRLTPLAPSAAITPTGNPPAGVPRTSTTLTGTIGTVRGNGSETGAAPAFCVSLDTGDRTVVLVARGRGLATGYRYSGTRVDAAHTGLFRGSIDPPARPIAGVGAHVALRGSYGQADPADSCGHATAFYVDAVG